LTVASVDPTPTPDAVCSVGLVVRKGALEAIFCTLALHTGVLPPTLNYQTPDPKCDLDYIPNEAREADARIAVSNSFGFGGHNASIVFRRFDR
jgi:3-oxoacyl-(acyl-carrier-protein) synthase